MRLGHARFILGGLLGVMACTTSPLNPFLTYTEEYGVAGQQEQAVPGGQAGGVGAEETFRRPLTLTFSNTHPAAILDTSFVAWIEISSVRSAGQQDALLANGYTQLTKEVRLGSVFVLPVGTFVFNGPGTAGATPVRLSKAAAAQGTATGTTPTTATFELISPDKVLMFSQPPVSCDSVAFTYSDPVTGEVLSGASTAEGGYKTLAQVDVYECSPLRPGLFFTVAGGIPAPNEFGEGEALTFTFRPPPAQPTPHFAFAVVTIGSPTSQP